MVAGSSPAAASPTTPAFAAAGTPPWQEIPPGNILQRWTKDSTERSLSAESKSSLIVHNDKMRKKMLLDKVFEIANREATLRETAFHQAMDEITGSSSPHPVSADSDAPNISTPTLTGKLQPTA
ncbi:hypothetical protein C2845_PM14G06200 [Panicum miliaceum]|uniref:Uncharacterized protein n=1 Tax=Panicum miliaceum TaxID=4540 RepID=A0A3L6PQH4_PANMI|nr:hypothetical protein C2845_PM14G06200 [Panicum miliaceum]